MNEMLIQIVYSLVVYKNCKNFLGSKIPLFHFSGSNFFEIEKIHY